MSEKKRVGRAAAGAAVSAGLLLLPPEGWEMEEMVIQEVKKAWSTIGLIDIERRRIGGQRNVLASALRKWSGAGGKDIILSVGLAGHGKADIAPDVTAGLLDRRLPGIEDAMYLPPRRHPGDLFFRGRAGIRGKTMIVNLPSRPAALKNGLKILAPVLVHAMEKIAGDESECALE